MSDKNSEFKKSEKIIAINMKISVFFFALTSWEFSDIFVFPKQKNLEYFKNFLTFLLVTEAQRARLRNEPYRSNREKVAIIGVVVILCIVLVITRCVRRNNGRTIYKDPLQTKIDF